MHLRLFQNTISKTVLLLEITVGIYQTSPELSSQWSSHFIFLMQSQYTGCHLHHHVTATFHPSCPSVRRCRRCGPIHVICHVPPLVPSCRGMRPLQTCIYTAAGPLWKLYPTACGQFSRSLLFLQAHFDADEKSNENESRALHAVHHTAGSSCGRFRR